MYSACGQCEYCLTGRETLCHNQLMPAIQSMAAAQNIAWQMNAM
nr:alcohol dehydrogenase catalytic domain-containing protein [Cytobacillus oceanisediminis]